MKISRKALLRTDFQEALPSGPRNSELDQPHTLRRSISLSPRSPQRPGAIPWPGGGGGLSHNLLDPRCPDSQPTVRLVERPIPEGGHHGPDTFSGNWILLSAGGMWSRPPRAPPAGPQEVRGTWLVERKLHREGLRSGEEGVRQREGVGNPKTRYGDETGHL